MNPEIKAALQKRNVSGGKGKPQAPATRGGNGTDFRFFTDETTGLKVQPKNVLVISLVYMGIVVLLHIFGKIRGGSGAAEL